MANKMLIDAAHPEETRVVVLRGNRIEEFDFEAANKKQLRGNIYLAKVTRVEPSLQAAFVEYGGNRHGFLAFSEIHPDYYQIPVADRQALLEEEARSHADEDEEHRPNGDRRRSRRNRRGDSQPAAARRAAQTDETVSGDEPLAAGEAGPVAGEISDHAVADPAQAEGETAPVTDIEAGQAAPTEQPAAVESSALPVVEDVVRVEAAGEHAEAESDDVSADAEADDETPADDEGVEEVTTLEDGVEASLSPADEEQAVESRDTARENDADGDHGAEEETVEQLGGDALEDVPHRVSRPRRHYKIQEVIKRRQVLLVQVVKEERGNKGAALTTYLSLAGRYSVLMPNTARGGGISRKITDAEDRKRLKAIAQELEVPEGMGIILRTAGAARGIAEVKRDFEYLMRMWETVRETTLRSSAPMLVYEEGSLIKRSIRDLFTKDVDEVIVSGDEAYREAKDFMRLLMPGQAKAVVPYRDPQPIFAKAGAEAQLDAMFSNQVTLRSGGYLVINQTEALVAIDVNSGRSTREHNIEDTALRTNLEAADEVARQLRLRDLAGLIVVDFIDMEEGRNDRAVERRLKDALKNDRARIQIGRISHFGLLEMSRQRMRTGVLEGSSVMCQHCAGTGTVRSMSSIALHVLRLIEDALIKSAEFNLVVRTRSEVALYILNNKRANLLDLETRFGVSIAILADVNMTGAVYHAIDRGSEATPPVPLASRGLGPRTEEPDYDDESEDAPIDEPEEASIDEIAPGPLLAPVQALPSHPRDSASEEGGRRRRRRRRRRGGRDGQGVYPGREGHGPEHPAHASTEENGDDDAELDNEELTDIAAGFAPAEAEDVAEAGHRAAETDQAVTGEGAGSFEGAPAHSAEQPVEAPGADVEPGEAAPEPAEAEAEAAETPRRRRTRRAPRAEAESGGTEPTAPSKRPRRSRARAADVSAEPEELKLSLGETAPAAAPEAASAPELPLLATGSREPAFSPAEPATEAASASPAPAESAAEVSAEPGPVETAPPESPEDDRPKRSGWWQRAKATFTS